MLIIQVILVLLCMYFSWISGAVSEREASGMTPARKWELTIKSLFYKLTFKKYYICDDCGLIKRRTDADLDVCGGRFEHQIFVCEECQKEAVKRIPKRHKTPTDSLVLYLQNRGDDYSFINDYDKAFLLDASVRLEELKEANRALSEKLYERS